MIPTFILVNNLHMVNTVWAILLPGAFNVWNMILARTYFQSIPAELREASELDGATEIQHFFKIMLPVCKPIIAVLALWSFVGMWNSYFDAMIYLNDADMQPLQLVLRSILVAEYAAAGNDRGYSEHGGDGEGGGTFEIRDNCCIEPSAADHVSVLPEVF